MPDYRFLICDVFTDRRFGGNPLAVLPDASGLTTTQMQQIAREFNFSESTFVLPASTSAAIRRVRIFTPTQEVPFAGHPNVGTAFTLATIGEFACESTIDIVFEEQAGLVPITLAPDGDTVRCTVTAPQPLAVGASVDASTISAALSLAPSDIAADTHPPRVASVGLPFVIAEVKHRDALARARIDWPGFEALRRSGVVPDVFFYCRSGDEFDLRARMFAPFDGISEDPATGSACCALAGLLSMHDASANGSRQWRIGQGIEMGRPSVLIAEAEKRDGVVFRTGVGGQCVMVSDGQLTVD